MAASISTPADICNLALVRIGHTLRIGSLYDGSLAAKRCLDIYAQTRDEMLRDEAPDFARREISLTLLKSAPAGGYIPPTVWTTAYPQLPFTYQYGYPADCIKFGSIRNPILFVPNFDPQPLTFSVANDNSYTPAQRVILCYTPNAIGTYVGQVTDPATMDVGFIESLAASLARRLAVALADPKLLEFEAKDEGAEAMAAETVQG